MSDLAAAALFENGRNRDGVYVVVLSSSEAASLQANPRLLVPLSTAFSGDAVQRHDPMSPIVCPNTSSSSPVSSSALSSHAPVQHIDELRSSRACSFFFSPSSSPRLLQTHKTRALAHAHKKIPRHSVVLTQRAFIGWKFLLRRSCVFLLCVCVCVCFCCCLCVGVCVCVCGWVGVCVTLRVCK
jgi:hypothetical protein